MFDREGVGEESTICEIHWEPTLGVERCFFGRVPSRLDRAVCCMRSMVHPSKVNHCDKWTSLLNWQLKAGAYVLSQSKSILQSALFTASTNTAGATIGPVRAVSIELFY